MGSKPPDAYRQKRVPQLRPWSPVASVDAYSKVVRYDRIIAETVKRGLTKNDHVRCKSSPAQIIQKSAKKSPLVMEVIYR